MLLAVVQQDKSPAASSNALRRKNVSTTDHRYGFKALPPKRKPQNDPPAHKAARPYRFLGRGFGLVTARPGSRQPKSFGSLVETGCPGGCQSLERTMAMTDSDLNLQIEPLLAAYETGALTPEAVLGQLHRQATLLKDRNIWTELFDLEHIQSQVAAAQERRKRGRPQPLFGVPFAVKDNIDCAGETTTAACPAFAYEAKESSPAVARLMNAGAILLGKTNLDQFATGLVGVRSPFGACRSAFDDRYISGGSSSGSALAVAHGLCSFTLGTDTAGSGRVPASLNNVVGLKPSRGLLSCTGVVPACRSLDCVSVFAGNVQDALLVERIAQQYDARDPYSRPAQPGRDWNVASPRVGVPRSEQLEFFGDAQAKQAFEQAVQRLIALGAKIVPIDFTPFSAAGALLYSGPWVAERFAGVGEFIESHSADVDATVRSIILSARGWTAVECFRSQYKLNEYRQRALAVWSTIDVLAVPTNPTTYTREEVLQNPIDLNSRMGTYTHFGNLLDLCGVAVPSGFKAKKQPFGITLLAPAFEDARVCELAARYHANLGTTVGATDVAVASSSDARAWRDAADPELPRAASAPAAEQDTPKPIEGPSIEVAVVGAHLRGQPLHHQLDALGAEFLRGTTTAARYELFALANTSPPKPGLVRRESPAGSIAVEVYRLAPAAFGSFVALVPPPLCIGNIELSDGQWVKGFLCEPRALVGARDITKYGGWLRFLKEATSNHA